MQSVQSLMLLLTLLLWSISVCMGHLDQWKVCVLDARLEYSSYANQFSGMVRLLFICYLFRKKSLDLVKQTCSKIIYQRKTIEIF